MSTAANIIGFPGNCGNVVIGSNQWISSEANRGQQNYQFSFYRIGTLTKTLKLNLGEALTSISEY